MNTIKILGSPLYQWEIGRKIQIMPFRDLRISAVHFSHVGDAEALVVKPKNENENDIITADIPNILLQDSRNLVVYVVDVSEDCVETLRECVFPVRPRPRPADYAYTETEVLNYSYLDKRLNDLEGEGLSKAVSDYLKDNPVQAGATAEEAKQIEQNKQGIETLNREKLSADALPNVVNEALAQAKESGMFDGKDGTDGKDGHTPVKGVDYFDGVNGKDGKDGKDGQNGQNGTTPVRGVDYWTDADKAEIKSYVDTAILGGAW